MAKADDDTITAWEFASEARDRLAKHYGGRKTAENIIREGLNADTLPWDFMHLEGRDPGFRDKRFWTEYNPPPGFIWGQVVTVNYEENSVSRPECTIRGFKVAKDYTDKLLGVDLPKSAVWCIAEAQRLKLAGKLDSVKTKTKFAEMLHKQMCKEFGEANALTIGSIRNQLKNWGLWPISAIKI